MTTVTQINNRMFLFIGRCENCGTARREYVGPFLEVDRRCDVCTGFSVVRLRPIIGTQTDKPCDARCTAATGRICSCSCAGRNHGSAHTWKALEESP